MKGPPQRGQSRGRQPSMVPTWASVGALPLRTGRQVAGEAQALPLPPAPPQGGLPTRKVPLPKPLSLQHHRSLDSQGETQRPSVGICEPGTPSSGEVRGEASTQS